MIAQREGTPRSSRILDPQLSVISRKQKGCGPSGLIETPDDTLLVTCYDSNTLAEVSLEGETVGTIKKDSAGEPFLGPNDFTKDSEGGIYFSASGVYTADAPTQGKVYYRAPGDKFRPVAKGIHYSNGLGLTPDGRLLVAEMLEKRILSYRVEDDGSLGDRQVFANTQELAPTPCMAPVWAEIEWAMAWQSPSPVPLEKASPAM